MDIEAHPFDLRECVESALDLIGGRAAEKHLEIACQFEGEVPAALNGDVARLRQVLLNLLSNSVKFTEAGEVVLTVRPEKAESGDLLHFSVRDTGMRLPHRSLLQPPTAPAPLVVGAKAVQPGLVTLQRFETVARPRLHIAKSLRPIQLH